MYTIRLPLELSKSEERYLSKCFYIGNKIHNSLVSIARKRIGSLFDDQEYLSARKKYGESGFSKNNRLSKEQKECKKQLSNLMQGKVSQYKLLSKDLDAYVSVIQKHYKNYISSHQAQSEVNAVYDGVKKVLYSDGEKLNFRKCNDYDCIKQKNSTNGVKLLDWSSFRFMKKTFRIKSVPNTEYMNKIINNVNILDDVVYSFLKRIEFNSRFKYYIIITIRGEAPKTVKISDNTARTGIDLGISTIATFSENNVHLEELAPKSLEYEKQIRHLQKLVDRSMRINNPNNYNKDGTIKKSKHRWFLTRKCKKIKRKIRVLYRKQSAYITTTHNAFLNKLMSETSEFILEPMNFKSLQKRYKKTELSDSTIKIKNKDGTEKEILKYKRKKRYGRSIKNRSPGLMQNRLKQKSIQYSIPLFEIDRNVYCASQFHHDTGELIKHKLSERTKIISGCDVQRDLYSAFLIANTNDTLTSPDIEKCQRLFPYFVEMHNKLINDMKKSGLSMKSCFGF